MTDDAPPANADAVGDVTIERQSPADAFGALASDIRLGVLRALGETPDESVSFSDLYDRVDVDDTGNFNYHLGQLQGSFVRKDDAGDYELTVAGRQVVGAIHAGTYTADATVDPIALDWDCLLCGGPMLAEYHDERAWVVCEDCEKGAGFSFPPGSLDQFDRAELPAAFARWLRHLVQQTTSGFCHVCAGRVEGALVRLPGGTEDDPKPSRVAFECNRCGTTTQFTGPTLATYHPEVAAFFSEHDLELLAGHASRAWSKLDVFDAEIRSEEPPRLDVTFAYDGDRVTAEIGPNAVVERVRRERD